MKTLLIIILLIIAIDSLAYTETRVSLISTIETGTKGIMSGSIAHYKGYLDNRVENNISRVTSSSKENKDKKLITSKHYFTIYNADSSDKKYDILYKLLTSNGLYKQRIDRLIVPAKTYVKGDIYMFIKDEHDENSKKNN